MLTILCPVQILVLTVEAENCDHTALSLKPLLRIAILSLKLSGPNEYLLSFPLGSLELLSQIKLSVTRPGASKAPRAPLEFSLCLLGRSSVRVTDLVFKLLFILQRSFLMSCLALE